VALISLGPIVGQARGAVGGVVFSHSRSGPTARAWTKPTNPATPAQGAVRGIHGTLHSRWRDVLTNTQRVEWNDLADLTTFTNRLGNQHHLSGQQLYIRNNAALSLMTRPLVDDAPERAVYPMPTFSFFKFFWAGQWTVWATVSLSDIPATTTYAAFWQSAFLGQQRYKCEGPWTFVALWPFLASAGRSMKLDTTPTFTADRRIFFRLRFADSTGAVSSLAYGQLDT